MPPRPQERPSPAGEHAIKNHASIYDELSPFSPAPASDPQRHSAPTEEQLNALIQSCRPSDRVSASNSRPDGPLRTIAPISNTAVGPFQPPSGHSRPQQGTGALLSQKSVTAAPSSGITFSQGGLSQGQNGTAPGLGSAQHGAPFMNQYNDPSAYSNAWNSFSFLPWAGMPCYTGSWANWPQAWGSGFAYPQSVLAPNPAAVRDDYSSCPQPVHKLPRSNSSGGRLSALDTRSLAAEEALFYFGVLSTLNSLAPKFQYSSYFDGTRIAKLSFRGDTVSKERNYDNKFEAKADACREALHILKSKFGNWTLPPLPRDGIGLAGMWAWRTVLQAYCLQRNIPRPEYTRYTLGDRFRTAVTVAETEYFGVEQSYETPIPAADAAAHNALYCLVLGIFDDEAPCSDLLLAGGILAGSSQTVIEETAPTCNAWDLSSRLADSRKERTKEAPLAQKPSGKSKTLLSGAAIQKSQQSQASLSNNPTLSAGNMRQALLKGAASEPAAMTRGILVLSGLNSRDRAQNIPAAANGKTGQLVSGSSSSRSPFAETSLNPSQIEREFGKSRSNVHREKILCRLLHVDRPKLVITTSNKRLGAKAYFESNDYLRRLGTIVEIEVISTSKDVLREACAGKVVAFLLDKIKEEHENRCYCQALALAAEGRDDPKWKSIAGMLSASAAHTCWSFDSSTSAPCPKADMPALPTSGAGRASEVPKSRARSGRSESPKGRLQLSYRSR